MEGPVRQAHGSPNRLKGIKISGPSTKLAGAGNAPKQSFLGSFRLNQQRTEEPDDELAANNSAKKKKPSPPQKA